MFVSEAAVPAKVVFWRMVVEYYINSVMTSCFCANESQLAPVAADKFHHMYLLP